MKNVVATLLICSLAQASWAAPANPVIDVYKSPTCGCSKRGDNIRFLADRVNGVFSVTMLEAVKP